MNTARVNQGHYRPDIDGLRAIAILLVLVYHSGLSLFPSGFIGVDVFFVISGFLITGIIQDGLNGSTFSFVDFYNRRLWRLQPVFICLLVFTMVFTLLFYLPDDLIQYHRSARKAVVFIANNFFNHTTTGYFAPNTRELPLLHTWSLSLEWQCYLLLPVVMYGLHRFFSKRARLFIICLITCACFLFSLYASANMPVQTYYQLSSRIFEFLIGGCIALYPFKPWSIHPYILHGTSVLALGVIVYIAMLHDILIGYPNGYALLVCAASGLLIAVGKFYPIKTRCGVLSWRPLVFIGLLSYSLYIWHWPLFSIMRYASIQETPAILCLAFFITFLLAYISWRYIEKPSRRFKQIPFSYTVISLLLLPVLFTHTTAYIIKSHLGYPGRFDGGLSTIYQELARYNSHERSLCIDNDPRGIATSCRVGSGDIISKTGLMIGDSFSNHYWGFMDTLGKDAHVAIVAQGTSSCITLPGIYLYDWWHFKNKIYQACHDNTAGYYRRIQAHHYDYVFIGQNWTNYLSDNIINRLGDKRSPDLTKQRLKTALQSALTIITRSGAKPVLIKSTASMQENFHDCFFKHIKLRQAYQPAQCSFTRQLSENEQWLERLFAEMKKQYPQLILIDPKKVQCPNNLCKADINGVPMYRDVGHITDYASYQLGNLYIKKFGDPLV